MIAKTWIVVSDGAHCRIFEHDGGSRELKLISTKEGAHRPNRDINSDREGRCFDSFGAGRHRYEPKHSSHELLKQKFVTEFMEEIEASLEKKEFNGIVFVCPPRILGYVRNGMSKAVERLITVQIRKDLVHFTPTQIFEELRSVLLPLELLKAELGIT